MGGRAKTKQDQKRPSEAAIEKAERFFTQTPNEPTPEQVEKSLENLDREATKLSEPDRHPERGSEEDSRRPRQNVTVQGRVRGYARCAVLPHGTGWRTRILHLIGSTASTRATVTASNTTPHVRYALEALLFVMGTAEIRAKEDPNYFTSRNVALVHEPQYDPEGTGRVGCGER